MQIQRIKTLSEREGRDDVITKDYFDSNPVFYSCYRIFPFERGHGIFVANSLRRFLLYEIPTIAITSVLIRTVKENSEKDNFLQLNKSKFELNENASSNREDDPQILTKSENLSANRESDSEPLESESPKPSPAKSSSGQLKKKKVTKKALKEQAAELFSYTSDPFAQTNDIPNHEEVDVMTSDLEINNQQSDQEVSALTEFTTIPFVRESFLEILLNLKACVFENTFAFKEPISSSADPTLLDTAHEGSSASERNSEVLKGKLVLNASQESLDDLTEVSQELFFQADFPSQLRKENTTATSEFETSFSENRGRRVREYKIWAKDLILPPGLKVKNPDLVLATLVAPKTNCELELSFEKIFQPDLTTLSMKTGRAPHRAEQKRRNVPIDGTLFPIKKVNFALSYTKFQKEVVTFEIWTNGSVNPQTAIFQCVEKILTLFQNLREGQVKEIDSFAETALDEFE